MKKLSLPLLIIVAALFLLTACASQEVAPAAAVAETVPNNLIIAGRLEPVNAMAQSFSIPGEVAEVLVQDGDTVTVGQVLARVKSSPEAELALVRAQQELLNAQQALDALQDNADFNLSQAKLARVQAEDELEKAQERYDDDETDLNQALVENAQTRLKAAEALEAKLKRGSGVDPDQKSALEARLASAKAGLVSAQALVDAVELKATTAGTIVDAILQPGEKVTAGQPVFTVADFSTWVVKTDNLTEVDVVSVAVGQKVNIVFDALPGQTMSGEVTHINRLYEEKRGDVTYTVTTKLNQTDPQLRWGMTAAVEFIP